MVLEASQFIICIASSGAGGIGIGAVAMITWKPRTPPSPEQVAEYMNRVVSGEEVEERFNLSRKMLNDADRRTMPRVDAGKPARVHTMRKRRPRAGSEARRKSLGGR